MAGIEKFLCQSTKPQELDNGSFCFNYESMIRALVSQMKKILRMPSQSNSFLIYSPKKFISLRLKLILKNSWLNWSYTLPSEHQLIIVACCLEIALWVREINQFRCRSLNDAAESGKSSQRLKSMTEKNLKIRGKNKLWFQYLNIQVSGYL